MENRNVRLPRGSTIVVTGVNGYIGSAVAKLLLELGYKVRGTVRAPKPWVNEYFEGRHGSDNFKTTIVPDFQDRVALGRAFKGASGIIHVAHDMSWSLDPNIAVTQPVNAVLNTLSVASQYDSIKRIVLTSTMGAAPLLDPDFNPATKPIDEDDWNDVAVEAAWSDSTPIKMRAGLIYAAAKVEGDKKALQWVHDNKPGFELNTVMPGFTFGKTLHPSCTGQSMSLIAGLLRGEPTSLFDIVPPWFIDTEDVARLHVIGLLAPELSSQRIFACAHPFTWRELIGILRELDPSNSLIPDGPEENREPCHIIPAAKAERMIQDFFGRTGFTSLRDSLAAALTKSTFSAYLMPNTRHQ
ncbi:NAD(P)-binding protein [Aspergillus cavernicola]|uniref:NAD(P)-binding protein n=1 Tax=Aspergillus cavernicola TaxID=176166 RepID=A0ABR4IH61_9EURO